MELHVSHCKQLEMATTEKEQVKVVTEAFASVSKALQLYDNALDQQVPWEDLKIYLKELHRYKSEYSKESAQLVREVAVKLTNGYDGYLMTTNQVQIWCDIITMISTVYEEGIKNIESASLVPTLVGLFDHTVTQLKAAQTALSTTSGHFSNLTGKMGILIACLERDFNENSEFFKKQVDKLESTTASNASTSFGLLSLRFDNKDAAREDIVAKLKQRLASVKQFHANVQKKINSANAVVYNVNFVANDTIPVIEKHKEQIEKIPGTTTFGTESQNAIKAAFKNVTDQCKAYSGRHQTIF